MSSLRTRGFVSLIGAGPGDPGLLTLAGAEALAAADVVVYDYLANPTLLAHARPEVDQIYVGKKAGAHTLSQEEINALLVDRARSGQRVARLKGGDPFVFGRGGEEALALVEAGLPLEVIPGVTSAVAGPAYAGIPVTHRGLSSSFAVIAGHEDPTKEESAIDRSHLATAVDTPVFLMGVGNLPKIVEQLTTHGCPPETPVALVHWGTMPDQQAVSGTLACNLACVHCRASAQTAPEPDELTTAEVFDLIDQLAEFSQPIFVVSGGEPLIRPDIYDIAAYGKQRGLRVAVSPNGTLLTAEAVHKLREAGVRRISVSIDGSTAARHDAVRGVPGAFESAMAGLARCREAGLGFQLNTTVMRQTRDDLSAVRDLALRIGAEAWHVFMLVPTGRGKIDDEVSPQEYEEILHEVYAMTKTSPIPIRVTCGPHFMRIVAQHRREDRDQPNLVRPRRDGHGHHPGSLNCTTRGCLAGDGYCFTSYRGDITPCGYFPVVAGNVRQQPFRDIYLDSSLFRSLRDLQSYGGKCGACEFLRVCGGCRARAYSLSGDYLAEEPYCTYQPRKMQVVGGE